MDEVFWEIFKWIVVFLVGFLLIIPIIIGSLILTIKSEDLADWIDRKTEPLGKVLEKPVCWILDKTCKKQIRK